MGPDGYSSGRLGLEWGHVRLHREPRLPELLRQPGHRFPCPTRSRSTPVGLRSQGPDRSRLSSPVQESGRGWGQDWVHPRGDPGGRRAKGRQFVPPPVSSSRGWRGRRCTTRVRGAGGPCECTSTCARPARRPRRRTRTGPATLCASTVASRAATAVTTRTDRPTHLSPQSWPKELVPSPTPTPCVGPDLRLD